MNTSKSGFVSKISVFIFAFLLLAFGINASATEETVLVAGNPDLYPIEYYDDNAGKYMGLMPELYTMLSKQTGYTFRYINEGNTNGQERMAKNCQAEIISAHLQGDIDAQYLYTPINILTVSVDGEDKSVNIAFSEVASEKLISDISNALSEMTTDKKLSLVSSHTMENGGYKTHEILIYILLGIIFLFLAASVVILVWFLKKRKSNEENLMIDPRYGIGNDKYYIYCFDNLISDKSKSLYYLAYIAFDEENFNQNYGDAESKNIQRYVAEFLNNKTGSVDYLSIVNEGVFAFIYQSANKEQAENRISSIMDELDIYLSQFRSDYAGLFHAGVFIMGNNMGCSSETAFYNAKQGYLYAVNCKMKFAFSTENIVEQMHQNERIHQHITKAIEDGEFQMYLQYIVDRNGKLFGAEAVSRWHNPKEGLLSPSKYIEMMNQTDSMLMHDLYIFSLACKQLEKWGKSNIDLCISCNFTRYSITDADFIERFEEVMNRYDFNHNRFIIEITEDSLSYDAETSQKNIERCKALGFLIALDDIGSGYTSFSDLYNYDIDFIKVERQIVLNAMEERGKMLLDGLIRLAHSMNIKVLCEGVEYEDQNNMVLSTGCDFIQGFYYSRALPVKEADKYLKMHYDNN